MLRCYAVSIVVKTRWDHLFAKECTNGVWLSGQTGPMICWKKKQKKYVVFKATHSEARCSSVLTLHHRGSLRPSLLPRSNNPTKNSDKSSNGLRVRSRCLCLFFCTELFLLSECKNDSQLSIYPSIYASIHPSIYLSISIYLYLYHSISISLSLPTYLPTYLSIYLSVYLSIIYLSIHPSIHPSIYLSSHRIYIYTYNIHIYIYLYIRK